MSMDDRPFRYLMLAVVLLSSVSIFILDIHTHLGTAGWIWYIIPLLISGNLRRQWLPFVMAAVFSLLVYIGLRLGPIPHDPHAALVNRLAGMAVMWVVAIIKFKRQQAEDQLRESKEQLHTLFQILPAGIAIVNGRQEYLEVNPALERLFGAGQKFPRRFLRSDGSPMPEHEIPSVRAIREQAAVLDTESGIAQNDGSIVWLSVNAAPLPGGKAAMTSIDITKRKLAETALIESEERYRRLFQEMSEGFALHETISDAHGKPCDYLCLDINPAFERLTGLTREHVIGRRLTDILVNEEPDWMERFGQVALTGIPIRFEQFSAGLKRHLEIEAYSPRPRQVAVIVLDITERKRAEEALMESEERFRTAMQFSAIGMAIVSAAGQFVEVNPALCEIIGYSRAELLSSDFQSITHPEDLPPDLQHLARMIKGEIETYELEKRYLHKKGNYIWVQLNVSLIWHHDGKNCSFVAQIQDITSRKQSADELFQSREMLRKILDHIPQRVFWKDTNSRFIGCNLLMARDCGLSDPTDVVGKTDCDLTLPARAELYRADDRQVMDTNQAKLNYEEQRIAADGRTYHLMTSKVPLHDADGRVIGVLGTYEDITERKVLEEQFRQSQKMEAVGRLAGGIAHDFNNLLTIISGYSDMMLAEMQAQDPRRDSLAEIKKASDRAAGLTRQLLAFSRKQVLTPETLDLNAVIRECETMFHRLLGEDIALEITLAHDLGYVQADASQLEQVLLNLLVNARDAMPQGGRLVLKTANAILDEAVCAEHTGVKPGQYILLVVSDTGVGMDENTKRQIFEPFFTTKQHGKGTGLGLAMVFGFIRQSGGHVSVASAPGRGSSFNIFLPESPASAPSGKVACLPEVIPPGHETILLVEDQNDVRALARHLLQSRGYFVLEAADGGEAVRLMETYAKPVHLLVSDVVMPGMGGRQLAERIVALRPDIKVLFVSGYTDDALVRQGIHASETNFLQKPFTGQTLHFHVRKALGH